MFFLFLYKNFFELPYFEVALVINSDYFFGWKLVLNFERNN